jgi:hypothetical protein
VSGRPEILDEAAIADDERAVARRMPIDVMQVPRLLGDIRTIAEGMAVLLRSSIATTGLRCARPGRRREVSTSASR